MAHRIEALDETAGRDFVTAGLEDPVVVLEHSMGAYIAYETARRLDSWGVSVERLILAEAAPLAEAWEGVAATVSQPTPPTTRLADG